jgi:hypothetical protein
MAKPDLSVSIKGRWDKLNQDRNAVLQRARECAKITIPQLLPPEGSSANTAFNTPWQGLGARGVNNLASKLILALFPPNQAFFRLKLSDDIVQTLQASGEGKATAEAGLAKMESLILDEMEERTIRMSAFEAIKQLVVTGNTLVYVDEDAVGMRVYRFDQYACKRDPMGNVIEIVTKEQIAPLALPDDLRAEVSLSEEDMSPDAKPLDLYTRVVRNPEGNGWDITQEIADKIIPASIGNYPIDKCPWIALRWSSLSGEDYGRGLVEEYLGDLTALEKLSQSIIEGSQAAAKLLVLVNPNGTTRISKVAGSNNLDVIEGHESDVTFLQVQKFNDFRVALDTIGNLQKRLSAAFLLNTSVQRDGERVTAEEIRYMAKELEDALGGVYSVLSKEFQLPLVKVIRLQMEKARRLPKLPEGKVRLVITTGLEALGRSHDLVKLNSFMQELATLGPEAIMPYINVSDYITRVANATGVDSKGLIKSEEEVMQAQAQAQQQMMQQEMLTKGIGSGAATEVAKGVMESGGQLPGVPQVPQA